MSESVASQPRNLCVGTRVQRLYERRDYRLRTDDAEWNVVGCTNCGLGFLNPRPTPIDSGATIPRRTFSKRKVGIPRYERLARYETDPPGGSLTSGPPTATSSRPSATAGGT